MTTIPIPNLLYRFPNYVHLQYRDDPTILGYQVRVADTLNNAYGNFNGVGGVGTEVLFEVNRGASFISKGIRRSGKIPVSQTHRGQTLALYDPQEFWNPPTTTVVPPDNRVAFVRTQVRTEAAPVFPVIVDNTTQSPIRIVEKAFHHIQSWPSLSLAGNAPTTAGVLAGDYPPEDAMKIMIPPFVRNVILTNLDGANQILYSVDTDSPLVFLPGGLLDVSTVSHIMGRILNICAPAGNPAFTLVFEYQPSAE